MKKDKFILCLMIVLSVSVSACAPEITKEQQNIAQQEMQNGDGTVLNIDNSSVNNMFMSTPESISKNIGNLSINAKVSKPQNVDKVPTLKAEIRMFDDAFYEDMKGDLNYVRTELPEDQIKGVQYDNAETKSIFSIFEGSLHYDYGLKTKIYELPFFYLETEGVYTDKDLDFMSKEQAIQEVLEVFKKYKINVSSEPKVYSYDADTLNMQQKKVLERGAEDEELTMFLNNGKTIKKDTFTKEDEAYYMEFKGVYNGIDGLQESYHNELTLITASPFKASVMYSREGIIEFHVEGVYDVIETYSDGDKIIGVDKAIESVNGVYGNVVSSRPLNIDSICFEYCPIPISENKKVVELIPVWRFSGSGKNILVNAITGELI